MKFFLLVFSLVFISSIAAFADTGTDLRAVTGAHTRVVWIEDNALDKPCVYSERATLRLMGLDSDDGKGERQITDKISSYWKPIITDDGKQVVFGELLEKTISIINWDGTGLRQVVKGAQFEDVWTDPRTKITWVYASLPEKRGDTEISVIRRYQMDKPEVSELVWDKMSIHMFMLSGDGRAASGGGDGGNSPQGMFTLPNGNFSQMAGGCWPSMSPDSSHRMWVFTGNHRSVHMCVPNRDGKAYNYYCTFDSFPELKSNHELYHPRWSNNIKFMTLTGPYVYSDWKWSSDVKISPEGAAKVEVYLGQFSPDFAKIDKWVRISNNDCGDYWPSAWIEPDPKAAAIIEPDEPDVPVAAPAQPDTTGLVYQYGYGSTASQVIDPKTGAIRQCSGILRDMARFTRYQVMDLTAGALVPADADIPLATGCKASNQLGIEMTINPTSVDLPYDAVILASADDAVNGNFFLLQRGEWLVLRLKTTEPALDMPLCKLTPNQPNHIVMSYAPDKLTCYLNGKRVLLRSLVHGDLSKWTSQHLIAGDAWTRDHNWAGLMEGFAIYNRVIPKPEAQARYNYRQEKAASRTAAKPITVDAKLTYRTFAADPKGIAPYRRCLSINRYTVVKVINGELKDNLIAVAQWSVLDAKVVPSYEKLAKDQVYRLTIEKWEDHPEQESERTMTGEIEGEEPDLYLDVTPLEIPRTVPRKASNITWTAGDGNWETAANWTNNTIPGKGGSVLLDNVAAGKRTVTTSQPVNIRELDINQTQTGVVNKLQLGDALAISGNQKPFAINAVEPTNVVLDLNGQPLLVENDTLSDVKLSGNIRMAGNGTVSAITVADGGYDYVKAPTVTLTGGGGKGAAAEALMCVSDISITKVGTGYTSNPTVIISVPEISGGRSAVATAYINKNNGTIDKVYINNPGSGYIRAP
ncbi:MAG: LamG-like jellyroll fold domain-containing protein, partial [bacterium]